MNLVARAVNRVFRRAGKMSYAQCGEDLIADYVFTALGVRRPTYLDIGANDPVWMSNTYLFYRRRCAGVCVEPNPPLYEAFRRKRPRDRCLNVGVGLRGESSADLFVMSYHTLSTFSRQAAEEIAASGKFTIANVLKVPLLSVDEIIARHFPTGPDFVSIDIEGNEEEILRQFDFRKTRPAVFCVETLSYSTDNTEVKNPAAAAVMRESGYLSYADTYVNTIFVDERRWRNRPPGG